MEGRENFRFLQGKEGVSGHIRQMDGGERAHIKGLKPGTEYAFYALSEGGCILLFQGKGEEGGSFSFFLPETGGFFAAEGEKVILWEEGDGFYFRACAALQRKIAEQKRKEVTKAVTASPAEKAAVKEEPKKESAEEKKPEWQEENWVLRSPGEGAPADDLPALFWPEKYRYLRPAFEAYPPIFPFSAPGWKFVRMPSPIREAAYGIAGYLKGQERVEKILLGVPGHPLRPPAFLPGYRYRQGINGMGYWILEQ